MDFSEVLKRRTIRQFTQEPLKKEDLCAILNAARLASCASNKQRLRYLVATESSLVAKILPHTAYAALVQPHRDPVPGRTSPTVFIAVVCNCEPGPLLHADAGAAIQSMEFAAWERGIGCCWIGSHKRKRSRTCLDWSIPTGFCIWSRSAIRRNRLSAKMSETGLSRTIILMTKTLCTCRN